MGHRNEINPWRDVETHHDSWNERTLKLANQVAGPRVLEVGAGRSIARNSLLARGFQYYSAEAYVSNSHDYSLDLNNLPAEFNYHFNSIFASGVLECVVNPKNVISWLMKHADEFIFSYQFASYEITLHEFNERTIHWNSHLSLRELISLAESLDLWIQIFDTWNTQALVRLSWLNQ